MDDLLNTLTGGGSLAWTLVCLIALAGLVLATLRLRAKTKAEERELRERLDAYRQAVNDDD